MKKNSYNHYLLASVFQSIMYLFFSSFNDVLFFSITLFVAGALYVSLIKEHGYITALFIMIIYSLPFSFYNVFGSSYAVSRISLFNIVGVFYVLFALVGAIVKKGRFLITKDFFLIALTALTIPIFVINAFNKDTAVNQAINFIMVLMIVLATLINKSIFEDSFKKNNFLNYYVLGTLLASVGIIVQFALYNLTGRTFAEVRFHGPIRVSYNFLFLDASFLTLYLASGAIAIYKFFIKNKKFIFLFLFGIVLAGMILNSARTGIFTLIIAVMIVTFKNVSFKLNVKSFLFLVLMPIALIGFYLFQSGFRGKNLFDDSGRIELIIKSIQNFMQNPFIGIGFGIDAQGSMTTHNIFFQYLEQGGILLVVLLSFIFISSLKTSFKNNKYLFYMLVTIFIGSMFIPNIFDSRFFAIILALSFLPTERDEEEVKDSDYYIGFQHLKEPI